MNINPEAEKLKNMEERMQKLEETLTEVLCENAVGGVESTKKLFGTGTDLLTQRQSGTHPVWMCYPNRAGQRVLKSAVTDLQKENEGKKVAFSAGLLESGLGHTGPAGIQKTLVYKRVFSNIGSAYDSNTGMFTAPSKGVYYFRFYAHCHGGTRMAVSLFKNDQEQCSVFSWKPVTNGNASNGIVLTLEAGDQIYTQLKENTWVYDDIHSYTSFSGFLIFPL